MNHLPGMQLLIAMMALWVIDLSYQNYVSTRENGICRNLEHGQTGFIQLTKSNEPGAPLVIYGNLIDRITNEPIKNASFFLYQTDSSGIYNTAGIADDQARIRGTLQTSETGCFRIKTILPGDYPGQINSRHIHYVINAAGYKELRSLIFFKGFTTPNITTESPLSILEINKEANGTLIGKLQIRMERTGNVSQ